MKLFCVSLLFFTLFVSCKEEPKSSIVLPIEPKATLLGGDQLAKAQCAACHQFVPPQVLSKSIWKEDVLPAMGHRLGIFNGSRPPDSIFGSPRNAIIVKKANIYPETPLLAKADWQKIVDYYIENAPDSLLPQKRNHTIKIGLKHFKYKEPSYAHPPPLTAMVKIRTHKKGLVFSDGKRNNNVLTFLGPDLKFRKNLLFKNTPVHFHEDSDTIYLTTIGKNIFPHDTHDGAIQKIVDSKKGQDQIIVKPVIEELQRPVFMAYGDLNNDGKEDIVACEYGDLTGKLVWYENQGDSKYIPKPLMNKPGAITAIINDYNADGLNDIFVLMAQGDEGIFYFENKGDGSFFGKRLFTFSPLNGSQYMELGDFNNDGHSDILYVCGDNADKTPILKDYHGIYIFLNDGNLNFTQGYFYQQNGAYKAMARDFDLDGDLDIAAISFFPDYLNHPKESFVYLENIGDLTFKDFSFPEATNGRWITMDVGDIDDDGDIDIALGSFVYFIAKGDTTGLSKKWLKESPSVILLENTLK
ncbi:VCBS repeat-containing protein [Maribacter polysiphoniae]|uniref:VCBS repeat protein n=1 Tax=Maribacter polysiphoniae TaxID=429344 RepID=A0A316E4Y0_9FLAO|nr:VCBS repeat-containing protein [Maribacter polysiphoniae]MBD1260996.1 VCBS repeat-containing protein [Maribacter polysiphoniae]PWK23763.1 VCBS repeat protein [Maribacter polysiphoniae]